MESRSFQRLIAKEMFVWAIALAGAYATFHSFEPLYERVRQAAADAGFSHVFSFEQTSPGVSRFNTRVLSASTLPLRGTINAGQTDQASTARKVVLSANDYGHFHAFATIRGQQVEFMTDTGATYVALSYETAQKLGLQPQSLRFNGRSTTANGVARVASVTLDQVRIGDITVRDVQAVVAEPGRMAQNLLGMSFIKQLSGFELNGAKLTMIE
ncbi:TIGR02281 family clan AA aspartic protease [Rhodomicrobium sp. Az07]|uniref:retropepsin-like aspartic protease family protein n=1 Tax=Rhodomicrobium sp. Az07 TaxID=2839034 RepID=UPI001BEA191F|nr:TIGR02281 family clan AA aspartic protease [Rhodomicrobium sp. Az07]MBT3070769.1 TIGR02281 family clan AA aspartic protease [Rhodomicrobium sp. Az07]